MDAAGTGGQHISLLRDEAVHRALRNDKFLAQWQTLFDACSHVTFFPSVAFARAWYGAYDGVWRPVLVVQRDVRGVLSGLWSLAHDPRRKVLVHAGAHQAEYHLWLARPGRDVEFIGGAWKVLTEHLEFAHLRLRYLPGQSLFEALRRARAPGTGILAHRHPRPLEPLDAGVIRDLTPDTDLWKARFAQAYDEVMEVELHRSAWPLWRARMTKFLADRMRRVARIGGFAPRQIAPRRLHRKF